MTKSGAIAFTAGMTCSIKKKKKKKKTPSARCRRRGDATNRAAAIGTERGGPPSPVTFHCATSAATTGAWLVVQSAPGSVWISRSSAAATTQRTTVVTLNRAAGAKTRGAPRSSIAAASPLAPCSMAASARGVPASA